MVRLATKYVRLAARSAVSISSRLVSGFAASTSVITVADIAGAFGKQYGVTVLAGKWHGARGLAFTILRFCSTL